MAKKSQRRATHKKQTRGINKHKLRAPFSDRRVAAVWVRANSVRQNYEALGAVADVNALASIPHAPTPAGGAAGLAAALDAPPAPHATLAAIQANPGAKLPHAMTAAEAEYLEALLARHGLGEAPLPHADDEAWRRMARDAEANYRQESAQRLATRCVRLRRFREEQAAHARAQLDEAAAAEAEEAILASAARGAAGDSRVGGLRKKGAKKRRAAPAEPAEKR